jgi:hypothetical protein
MVLPVTDDFMHALEHTLPLAGYIVAIVIFAIFVFSFYRFFSKRNMFELNLTQYNTARHPFLSKVYHAILYLAEYIFLFPIVTFAWFLLIAVSIGIVTDNSSPDAVFFIAVALAGAIRLSAYYSEQLAQELAKTLPLALLGLFIVQQSDITTFASSLDIVRALPEYALTLAYYFVFVVLLEFVLRLTHAVRFAITGKDAFGKASHAEDHDDTH